MTVIKIRHAYDALLKRFLKRSFRFWQGLGFHITANHFYEPIPDTSSLKDELWSKPTALVGVDMNEESQLALLADFVARFRDEYESLPMEKTSLAYEYHVNNNLFAAVDGEILYCMIRYFKPAKIIEIGSGYSTYLSAQAVRRNKTNNRHECELIACEPFPNNVLRKGFPGLSKLIPRKIQDVALSEFESLHENDILFIDSSHVLKTGSDVQYECLEILPRLNRGVIVHFHDIFLPEEYPKEWITKKFRFWNEQYLLQAFLSFNDSFEILWAGSYLGLKHPDLFEKTFKSYNRGQTRPGSVWLRRIK